MKLYIFLLAWLTAFACYDGLQPHVPRRPKRDAAGALHIVTNHAQPIHADVKPESTNIEKPCPKNLPSQVESGVVYQVTPPKDTFYQTKSLRKSLDTPSTVDLIRTVGRLVTLIVLVISAVFEFYPLLTSLYHSVYSFLYL